MKKSFFASACVFCFLIMAFPARLFAQKDTVVWVLSTDKIYKGNCAKILLLSKQLEEKGYDTLLGVDCREMSNQPRAALMKFQKDNNLPVGRLDTATLKALGIEVIRGVVIDDSWANPQLQKALRQFQRDNGLREGFLDDKTLKALGIEK